MTPEIDSIGAAIVKGVCNPEAKDLAVDLGEFELGALLDEGVLQETPTLSHCQVETKFHDLPSDRPVPASSSPTNRQQFGFSFQPNRVQKPVLWTTNG